ncbi:MAG TPA: hypothetical protein VGD37_08985 [Kofleriaceae bacterium]
MAPTVRRREARFSVDGRGQPGHVASHGIERIFALFSAARGKRIFHPEGVVWSGRLSVNDSFPGSLRGTLTCEIRLSRAFGLPVAVGDFYGLAIRAYPSDRDVLDLLFASSFGGALGKWVPCPHRNTPPRLTLSALLPYATTAHPRRSVAVGAHVTPGPAVAWESMIRAATPPEAIALWTAAPFGPPIVCGAVDGFALAPPGRGDDLRFNPWHAPPGLRPAGSINKLRRPAYRGSQRGRSTGKDRASF